MNLSRHREVKKENSPGSDVSRGCVCETNICVRFLLIVEYIGKFPTLLYPSYCKFKRNVCLGFFPNKCWLFFNAQRLCRAHIHDLQNAHATQEGARKAVIYMDKIYTCEHIQAQRHSDMYTQTFTGKYMRTMCTIISTRNSDGSSLGNAY